MTVTGRSSRLGYDIDLVRGRWGADAVVLAIVEVDDPSYLPEGMTLSREIGGGRIKTVTFRVGDLPRFDADPRVLRLGMPRPLHPLTGDAGAQGE